ncbi:MAG TPA: protein kinase [Vicinamibacterales bacterium]|jgi:Tol biopolymer transport system component|nr:protein kinase [Vicinamibacterales bacterium]
MSIVGGTVAHYRVTERIGAGGMGEVYRATDSKLNRQVAIKVLPDACAQDPERMARFHREAQVLASLSHPNIASIYGLEESTGGVRALVMELVDGEELSQKIQRGALPMDEALRIALAIAEALEAAHEHGVIHRDLKPANVKVTPDGQVKVLDFGLAKAFETGVADGETNPALSPTLSIAATRAGLILGTAAYMSPEQASGAVVDKRSDVWSFGVVLFEMLTGKRLFDGETVSHTLADVLRGQIDWTQLPASTPRAIRQLLERCLERDRRRRLRDIGEARITIEEQLAAAASLAKAAPAAPAARERQHVAWLPWSVSGLATIALVTLAAFTIGRRAPASPPHLRFDARLSDAALWTQIGPAIDVSGDGSHIAYVTGDETQRQLYVRPTDQLAGTKLAEGNASTGSPYHPFFSPDGAWIGYAVSGELRKIPVTGGTPLTLCKVSRSRGAWWGPDDMIVLAPSPDSGLFRVPAAGGEPKPLTTLNKERKEVSHRWPQVLPGGKQVLFTSSTSTGRDYDSGSIEVVNVDTGVRTLVVSGGTFGRYVAPGYLLYVNKGTVFAVPFDLTKLEMTGTPAPVLQQVTSTPTEGGAQMAFSTTGLLAYIRGGPVVPTYPVVWVDRDGRTSRLLDEQAPYANPRLSPDGKRLSLTIFRDNNWDVWVYDIERGVSTRLTFDETAETEQIWSPDGRDVIFSSSKNGPDSLFRKPADGSGQEQEIAKLDTPMWATSWSPDSQTVAYTTQGSSFDIGMLSLADHKSQPLLTSTFGEKDPAFSPDGKWLAYSSTESGQPEIYVRPFGAGTGRWQISDTGGVYPKWSRSGRELFYRNGAGVMVASIEADGPSLRTGKPRQLFTGQFRGGLGGIAIAGNTFSDFDVSPDGQRFVMFPSGGTPAERGAGLVTIVSSWFDELAATFHNAHQ